MGREDETPDSDLRAMVTSDNHCACAPLLTSGFLIADMMSSLLCLSRDEEKTDGLTNQLYVPW